MNLNFNKYVLTSNYNIDEVKERLHHNTLNKTRLLRVITGKRFIGKIHDEGFSLIESSPLGVMCVLNGKFENTGNKTTVAVEAKIQKAFLILFVIWVIILTSAAIVFGFINDQSFSVKLLLYFLAAAVCFRLFIHLVYIRSRNLSIKIIKDIIA